MELFFYPTNRSFLLETTIGDQPSDKVFAHLWQAYKENHEIRKYSAGSPIAVIQGKFTVIISPVLNLKWYFL